METSLVQGGLKARPEAFATPEDQDADLSRVRAPAYGRWLEECVPGRVFRHPRGITLTKDLMLEWATTFMEANPVFLNEQAACQAGYTSLPAAPHLVMNLVLSMGVQNNSEKAIANLGYYDVRFLRPVYAGDTLTALSRVKDRRDRGPGKPGIITVDTLGLNQAGLVVISYSRKILIPREGDGPIDPDATATAEVDFPQPESIELHIPAPRFNEARSDRLLSSDQTMLQDFQDGEIIIHPNGRTITDEHIPWTYRTLNTHPLHYDRLYSAGREGPMSGEPVVYGGLVFAWLLGLASRECSDNALWEMGFHEGYHTQPSFSGDTVYALTRIRRVEAPFPVQGQDRSRAGVVHMQLIGLKNLHGREALERYGSELFRTENLKKARGQEKIPEKIFEIERQVLLRAR